MTSNFRNKLVNAHEKSWANLLEVAGRGTPRIPVNLVHFFLLPKKSKYRMNFAERYDKIASIAQFIREENTGNPKEFAKKCHLDSEKTLLRLIDTLRQFTGRDDAEIRYNRDRKTYYFDPPGKFSDFKFIKDN